MLCCVVRFLFVRFVLIRNGVMLVINLVSVRHRAYRAAGMSSSDVGGA